MTAVTPKEGEKRGPASVLGVKVRCVEKNKNPSSPLRESLSCVNKMLSIPAAPEVAGSSVPFTGTYVYNVRV